MPLPSESAPPETSHVNMVYTPLTLPPPLSKLLSPPRRSRALVACLRCKLNKVRCDENRPCTRCLRQGCSQTCLAYSMRPTVAMIPAILSQDPSRDRPQGWSGSGKKRWSCEGCRQKKVRCSTDRPCSKCGGSLAQACRDCLESMAPCWGALPVPLATRKEDWEAWRESRALFQKRRRQVGRACERCRQSKVGCDESRPCVRCMRAGQACTANQAAEADAANEQQENEEEAEDQVQETAVGCQGGNRLRWPEGGESESWEGPKGWLEAPWDGEGTDGLPLEDSEATGEVGRAVSWEDWEKGGFLTELELEPSLGREEG
eukprot:766193-Hanusia_phi.AAC.1